jgi:nitrous oxidase accessory protein NosD
VIDHAAPGDTIAFRDACVGRFTITKRLSIVGMATAERARPLLTSKGTGRVLLVKARVSITNVKIADGWSRSWGATGGGIRNEGTLTLIDSVVTRNRASGNGGGIANYGTLTLKGSVVSRNRSKDFGGGIYNSALARSAVLLDTVVRRNVASLNHSGGGGGIYSVSDLILSGSTYVRYNTSSSDSGGGGIYNAATVYACDGVGADEWTGSLSPNTPDDSPVPAPRTCT